MIKTVKWCENHIILMMSSAILFLITAIPVITYIPTLMAFMARSAVIWGEEDIPEHLLERRESKL